MKNTACKAWRVQTFEKRTNSPDRDRTETCELSETHLKEQHRETDEKQRDDVRYEEGSCKKIQKNIENFDLKRLKISKLVQKDIYSTSSISVAQVGEAPDVSQTDRVAKTRKEVLDFATPRLAVAARVTSTSLLVEVGVGLKKIEQKSKKIHGYITV